MHEALDQNIRRPHGYESLRVEGVIPRGLRGTLFRAGPGLYERFGKRVGHPFEADGVVTSVRIDGDREGGRATGAARIVESAGYREEQARQALLYSSAASWPRRCRNAWTARTKSTGNTSVMVWDDQLLALMEGARPVAMDLGELASVGETDLDGVVRGPFSAHPHRVESLRTTFNFGLRYGRIPHLDLYALPDRGGARHLGSVPAPGAGMVHDFMVTEHHALFLIGPAKLVLWRALLQVGSFERWFRWDPDEGTEVLVVPLADPHASRRFRVPAFWVWHFANAWEQGERLVVDMVRYSDLSTLGEIGGRGESAPSIYHRAVICPERDEFTSEAQWDQPTEFPKVHPRAAGRPHRFAWMLKNWDGQGEGLARLDLRSGTADAWRPEPTEKASEPIPVAMPDEDDESAVWLLSLVHDDEADASHLAILDGRDVARGPIARLWFDQPIPTTYHGTWSPSVYG